MTNTLVLFKKLLATLMLVGMMTAFVTGCSSSGDSDDAAADESAAPQEQSEESGACAALPDCADVPESDKPECEAQHRTFCNDI
jgi:hypothetical protein